MPARSKLNLAVTCILAVGMCGYYFGIFLPKAKRVRVSRDLDRGYAYGCDFYQIWLTSHDLLLHGVNPYTAEMTTRIQLGVFGRAIDAQRPGDPRPYLALFPLPTVYRLPGRAGGAGFLPHAASHWRGRGSVAGARRDAVMASDS